MTPTITTVCPQCGGVNRARTDKPADGAKCGACKAPLFTGHPVEATEATFDRHASKTGTPVLVDFTASWCGPCKALTPVLHEVTRRLEPTLRVLSVDVDKYPGLARRFGVQSVPTLVLMRDGREVARRMGAMDLGSLLAFVGGQPR